MYAAPKTAAGTTTAPMKSVAVRIFAPHVFTSGNYLAVFWSMPGWCFFSGFSNHWYSPHCWRGDGDLAWWKAPIGLLAILPCSLLSTEAMKKESA
jgi:hypothetical protein